MTTYYCLFGLVMLLLFSVAVSVFTLPWNYVLYCFYMYNMLVGFGFMYFNIYWILYDKKLNLFPGLTLFYFFKNHDYEWKLKDNDSVRHISSIVSRSERNRDIKLIDVLGDKISVEEYYQHLIKEFSRMEYI